ncbi:MFS transporter [Agromyces aureus]|uniref:Major facilitator superfamily (MFS) profile domain-containing protein n=1 Tax=Agromyces aureus TaxID=453304 RepID=A0A191WFU9_9MICO|nr:MFS transporter [Agromyces aureus]ANJ27165.1 hypothetical protein ATC03_10945 [Agromyces aureus]
MTEPIPGGRRRLGVLLICCLGLLLVSIDNTIVNVALPQLRTDLDATLQSLQWVVGGYVLALGSGLLLASSLADRLGRKRVFLTGVATFTLFSALSSVAPDEGLLVAFRCAQGVGGAMMTPVALAIIASIYTGPAERARAIGLWGAVSGIGIAIGPLLGGLLVDGLGWRAVFWINVPIGILTFVLTAIYVPESRSPTPRSLDPIGQVFVIGLLGFSAYGIIQAPVSGISLDIIGAFVLAGASFAGLMLWEPRRREPLVDLRTFRDGLFTKSFLIATVAFFAFAGLLFANTFYLQDVRGLSPTAAGLVTLALAVAVILTGPLSGRLVAAGRTRLALGASGAVIGIAGVLLIATAGMPVWFITIPLLLFGAGFALLNDPINVAAVSEMPSAQAAVGAGIMSTAKQVGQLLGVSVIGAVLATTQTTTAASPPSEPTATAIMSGMLIVAGLVIGLIAATMPKRLTDHSSSHPSLAAKARSVMSSREKSIRRNTP